MRFVACIGPRQLPPDALALCRALGRAVTEQGWTVVTGGAPGADQAFATGADPSRLILVVPWARFEAARLDPLVVRGAQRVVVSLDAPASQAALALHPVGDRLRPGTRLVIARDGWLVAPPVRWCLAWPGPAGGGTAFTMSLARDAGLPVSDLRDAAVRPALSDGA